MPIYEYRCGHCSREFEELVGVAAATEPQSCPDCGQAAERLLSSFAVRVSGSASRSGGGKDCGSCRRSSCATC